MYSPRVSVDKNNRNDIEYLDIFGKVVLRAEFQKVDEIFGEIGRDEICISTRVYVIK